MKRFITPALVVIVLVIIFIAASPILPLSFQNVGDMRAYAPNNWQVCTLWGNTTIGDQDVKLYRYDLASTAIDDGDLVIKPTSITHPAPGRYLRMWAMPKKRQETYSGSTNSSGLYTVTYATSYSVAPNVQFQLGTGANNKETILLTSSTTTGFTVYVQLRADVLGLLPSYSNVNGRNVDIVVTEK